jgi:hypothetical protein
MKMTPPLITLAPAWFGTHRMHTITGLTAAQIGERLDGIPQSADDPHKVVNSWRFKVNGKECAVWDYKGSHLRNEFSAFGPVEEMRAVFGDALK